MRDIYLYTVEWLTRLFHQSIYQGFVSTFSTELPNIPTIYSNLLPRVSSRFIGA